MNLQQSLQKVNCILIGGPCDGMRYQTYAGVRHVIAPGNGRFHRYKLRGTPDSPVLNAEGLRIIDFDRTIKAPNPCSGHDSQ